MSTLAVFTSAAVCFQATSLCTFSPKIIVLSQAGVKLVISANSPVYENPKIFTNPSTTTYSTQEAPHLQTATSQPFSYDFMLKVSSRPVTTCDCSGVFGPFCLSKLWMNLNVVPIITKTLRAASKQQVKMNTCFNTQAIDLLSSSSSILGYQTVST